MREIYCRNDLGGGRITRLVAKLIVSRITSDNTVYSKLVSKPVSRQNLMELAERVKCDFAIMNIEETDIRDDTLEDICKGLDIQIPGSITITRQEFESYCGFVFDNFEEQTKLFKSVRVDSYN